MSTTPSQMPFAPNQESKPTTSAQAQSNKGAPEPQRNPLAELAQLLRNEKEGTPDADSTATPPVKDAQPPAPKDPPKNLAALAEALGVEVSKLYDIQIPSARDGEEPYTLGKLKDLAADHGEFTVRTIALEEEYRKKQGEYMRAEQELQAILATLPADAISEKARSALRAKRDQVIKAERTRVLETIPEWQDVEVRTQELEQIVEHLRDYGFPENYITSIFDHRTLRYIRENWRREVQLRKALERVQERKPTPPPKSKPPTGKPQTGTVSKNTSSGQRNFSTTILNRS
jgi:hypothetical protein